MNKALNTAALLLLSASAVAAFSQAPETGLRSDWTVVLRPDGAPGQAQPARTANPSNEVVRRAAFKTKNGCWLLGMPYQGYREECVSDSIDLRPARSADPNQAAMAAARPSAATQPSVLWVSKPGSNQPLHGVVIPRP